MKAKLFTLLTAAMLLVSAGAFAQSNEPLKGDVNGDGIVDVADVVSILHVLKNAEGTDGEKMYYWYAGAANDNAVRVDNYTDVASLIAKSEIPESGTVTSNGQYVYFVMPASWHLSSLTDAGGSAVEYSCIDVGLYNIYKTTGIVNGTLNYSTEGIKYYFYIGTDEGDNYITADNYTSIATLVSEIPTAPFVLNANDKYIYIVVPATYTVTGQDPDTGGNAVLKTYNTEYNKYMQKLSTVDGYKLYRTVGKWYKCRITITKD